MPTPSRWFGYLGIRAVVGQKIGRELPGRLTFYEVAEGHSLVPGAKSGTIREGVVVKPIKERWVESIGRLCLKVVSGAYLEKYR